MVKATSKNLFKLVLCLSLPLAASGLEIHIIDRNVTATAMNETTTPFELPLLNTSNNDVSVMEDDDDDCGDDCNDFDVDVDVDVNANTTATDAHEPYDQSSSWATDEDAMYNAYLAKPFALLSILCSYVICREIGVDQKKARNNNNNNNNSKGGGPIPRMLVSMALADILISFAMFLGTWPTPRDYEYNNVVGNVGNQVTCTMQGMLIMFGFVAGLISNATLAVYYLLVVKYGKKDRDLARRETWVLGGIWLVALAFALYPIPLQMYNMGDQVCSLESAPPRCDVEAGDCVRGGHSARQQTFFALLPVGCLSVSMGIMISLIVQVRKLENKNKKYAATNFNFSAESRPSEASIAGVERHQPKRRGSNGSANSIFSIRSGFSITTTTQALQSVNRKKSNAVGKQAIFYALAFLMTYLCGVIAMLQITTTGTYNAAFDRFAWLVCAASAGTFNFFVFSRVRTMQTPEGRILRSILFCVCLRKAATNGPAAVISSVSSMVIVPRQSQSRTDISGLEL